MWRSELRLNLTKRFFKQLVLLPLALCCVLLLSACQEQEWYLQHESVDSYEVAAQFPSKPSILRRSYQLLANTEVEPLDMVQWYATEGENSFNLSYILVPHEVDARAVANELLRSMMLKRDPRLVDAPAEFVAEYENDLPAVGEQFTVSVGMESRSVNATAMVLQEGNLVVQVYAAGASSNKDFAQQRQRFFEQLKIGATIQ
ncbi:MAG: hypothetical protein GX860_05145 [Alcaligenaceae bacterium]|jgi:hypothetical protein|nr:hypothetical protein [Alcaligenaceae bacterium]